MDHVIILMAECDDHEGNITVEPDLVLLSRLTADQLDEKWAGVWDDDTPGQHRKNKAMASWAVAQGLAVVASFTIHKWD